MELLTVCRQKCSLTWQKKKRWVALIHKLTRMPFFLLRRTLPPSLSLYSSRSSISSYIPEVVSVKLSSVLHRRWGEPRVRTHTHTTAARNCIVRFSLVSARRSPSTIPTKTYQSLKHRDRLPSMEYEDFRIVQRRTLCWWVIFFPLFPSSTRQASSVVIVIQQVQLAESEPVDQRDRVRWQWWRRRRGKISSNSLTCLCPLGSSLLHVLPLRFSLGTAQPFQRSESQLQEIVTVGEGVSTCFNHITCQSYPKCSNVATVEPKVRSGTFLNVVGSPYTLTGGWKTTWLMLAVCHPISCRLNAASPSTV